jgi:hypothetical protein
VPVNAARVRAVFVREGQVLEGTVESARPRPTRADLVRMLDGARKVLASISTPVGGAYRRDLVARINDALRREGRS